MPSWMDLGWILGGMLREAEIAEIYKKLQFLLHFKHSGLPKRGRKSMFFGGRCRNRFWRRLGGGFGGQDGGQMEAKTAKNRIENQDEFSRRFGSPPKTIPGPSSEHRGSTGEAPGKHRGSTE